MTRARLPLSLPCTPLSSSAKSRWLSPLSGSTHLHFSGFVTQTRHSGETGRPFLFQGWTGDLSVPVKSVLLNPCLLPGENRAVLRMGSTQQGPNGHRVNAGVRHFFGDPLRPVCIGRWSSFARGPVPSSVAPGSGFHEGKKISWHCLEQGPELGDTASLPTRHADSPEGQLPTIC